MTTQARCVQPVQVGDDRRQRGRDDRLVERRQEHPEHQRADDETAALHGERGVPVEDFLGRDERLGHEMSIAFCGCRLLEHRTSGRSRRGRAQRKG